jgi:thiosulfate/3-mercaptopyruvate sulfurtransferase
MNKKWIFFLFALAPFRTEVAVARDVPAIVSTDWLSQNMGNTKPSILDIRTAALYGKGHIPGSINIPFSLWAISTDGLLLELPSDAALRDLLQKSGIDNSSIVVIVNKNDTDFNRADATRVAWTCMVAGIKNVAVLDGGINKWIKDKKAISTEDVAAQPALKTTAINRSLAASKNYVLGRIGKSVLLDARTVEDYFGITSKPGHIKSAVSLPVHWVFSDDGTYQKTEELRSMAAGVLGSDISKEVIVYCGVGGFASTWWFVLTQMLGYQDVKLYDGSMEEWTKDPQAPVSTYSWH